MSATAEAESAGPADVGVPALQLRCIGLGAAAAPWLAALSDAVGCPFENCRAQAEDRIYAYPPMAAAEAAERAIATLPRPEGSEARLHRLQPLADRAGAAAGREAPVHYVVELDIPDAIEAEFERWYATEHVPGLAAVAGTVRVRRFRNDDGGPHYLACYDVIDEATLRCDAWTAVRLSPWSEALRRHFLTPRRTVFHRFAATTRP